MLMPKIFKILLTILSLQFVTPFYVIQEKFVITSNDPTWIRIEYWSFNNNTFNMQSRHMRPLNDFKVRIRGTQRIGRKVKPSPFNWNIDMCKFIVNPLKYNFVVGTVYLALSKESHQLKRCPIPANSVFKVDNYVLKSEFLPKFFPPGRFMFNLTITTAKIKILEFEWIWNISHQKPYSSDEESV